MYPMTQAPIGLFYGSSTCYTEMAAETIAARLGEDRVDVYNVAETPVSLMENYPLLILGIPTWDYGELQEDWENCWEALDNVDFSDKTVALFGLGDQIGYPEWFLDALGFLWAKVCTLGATTVGFWPVEGFQFSDSKALTADGTHFVGLAIDEENQFELTDQRIERWCTQLLRELHLNSP